MSESFYHFSDRAAGRWCCFVGGFVDSAGYSLLHGLFTASITGNIVKFSEAASHNQFSQAYVLVTTCFGLGSILARLLAQYLTYKMIDFDLIGMCIFVVEVVLLIVTIFIGSYYERSIADGHNFHILTVGMIMALPMGVQYSVAANAFKTFPNTTGMTASVATAFSAIANVIVLYLSEWGLVNFYLSKEERNGLDSITAKKKLYDFKKNCAFDELDRQFNPLL